MIVYFHNPNPNPYLYDLFAMRYADLVVVNDQMHYNRKSAAHRINIGTEWLALPFQKEEAKGRLLGEIPLQESKSFANALSQKLVFYYGQLTHFDHFAKEVEAQLNEAIHTNKNLHSATQQIFSSLVGLAEWPIPKEVIYYSQIGKDSCAESVDIAQLDFFSAKKLSGVMHNFHSQNYQRQSSLRVGLKKDVVFFMQQTLKMRTNATLLELLFSMGAYHAILDWPN